MRAWGAASGNFERRLAEQESPAVIAARVESQTRRGRDYVRVTVAITVAASDVAEALDTAWRAFREAVSRASRAGTWPARRPRFGPANQAELAAEMPAAVTAVGLQRGAGSRLLQEMLPSGLARLSWCPDGSGRV